MKMEDIVISEAIIRSFSEDLLSCLRSDVAIVGGGPAGLTAGFYLARNGHRPVLFERRLSIGGGMWGGGMMFNKVVVQSEAREILDEMGISHAPFREGYYVADSVEAVTTICSQAVKAGLKVFNLVTVEDVMVRRERIAGLVLNWSAALMAGLHVDPLSIEARYILDATGHDSRVVSVVQEKMNVSLPTPTGRVMGERPLWAESGEAAIVGNTKEVYPGLFVAGMAANAVFGSHRMGPVFGGMLLSGRKAADEISKLLR